MNRVAVVILNWNGCDMLRTFLPSVVTFSEPDGASVYVADNGSTDASVAMLRAEFPSVRIVELGQNYGFAEGYNRALRQLAGEEYVVLLNSDVEVTEHWLSPLVAYMDAHPETAACQPKIRSRRNKALFEYAGAAGGFIDRYGYPFCRGRIMGVVEEDHGQYDTPAPLFWATGAALFIRRRAYFDAGGLDGRFFAHMEEIDLCWRLRSRGQAIVCLPQSTVYHVGGATLQTDSPRKTYLNFRNNLLMLYKNLPERELRSVMRIRSLLDALASLRFLLGGQWANFRAVIQARRDYRRLRPGFTADRAENLRLSTLSAIPERTGFSLLWRFYVRRLRFFSELLR